mgnify:CR=1 FL=1
MITQNDKPFLGQGWTFPLRITPDRGRISLSAGEEDIKQSIRIILATSKGERVMRPDFGCGIHELSFQVINTALINQIEHTVKDALRKFEARIEVLNVSVDVSNALNGHLLVSIDYRVQATNKSDNLVYPFYLKESTRP